jgi:hypothetical protein
VQHLEDLSVAIPYQERSNKPKDRFYLWLEAKEVSQPGCSGIFASGGEDPLLLRCGKGEKRRDVHYYNLSIGLEVANPL